MAVDRSIETLDDDAPDVSISGREPAEIVSEVGSDVYEFSPRLSSTPGEMCAVELESMAAMSFPRTSSTPGEMCTVDIESRTVWGFPQNDSTPGESCAVELDFPRASFTPGESCAEDYIRPAWLAGSSVCTWTVTGSLLFGSPHRLVQSCLRSAVLSLRRIDDLDIFQRSTDIPQNHHLVTVVSPSPCILEARYCPFRTFTDLPGILYGKDLSNCEHRCTPCPRNPQEKHCPRSPRSSVRGGVPPSG